MGMLKQNEVRDGNLIALGVREFNITKKINPRLSLCNQIFPFDISFEGNTVMMEDDECCVFDNYFAIPLTRNIVQYLLTNVEYKVNSFEIYSLCGFYFEWIKEGFYQCLKINEVKYIAIGCKIKYIHQLQNRIYSLTNEELVISNQLLDYLNENLNLIKIG